MTSIPRVGDPLTTTETQILELVAVGLTNPQIARRMSLSVDTIKTHLHKMLCKTGTATRTALAMYAAWKGLVHTVPTSAADLPFVVRIRIPGEDPLVFMFLATSPRDQRYVNVCKKLAPLPTSWYRIYPTITESAAFDHIGANLSRIPSKKDSHP